MNQSPRFKGSGLLSVNEEEGFKPITYSSGIYA